MKKQRRFYLQGRGLTDNWIHVQTMGTMKNLIKYAERLMRDYVGGGEWPIPYQIVDECGKVRYFALMGGTTFIEVEGK